MNQSLSFYERYAHVIDRECHAMFSAAVPKEILTLNASKKRFKICSTSPELNIMPLELFIQRIAFIRFKRK